MDLGLKNAAVLVTGGSKGIGRRTALTFAAEGARVAITYNTRKEAADEVAAEIAAAGGQGYVVPMSLDEPATIEAAVDEVVRHWGGLDALVSNAVEWGTGNTWQADRIEDADATTWLPVLRANLAGGFRVVQQAAPALRRSAHGRLVLVSSDLAEHGMIGSWAYSAAKAGLHGLAASLAPDLGRDGVLVNVVMPGVTLEDGHHQVVPDEALPAFAAQRTAYRLPTVEDVATAIVVASSPRTGATQGEIIRVTGGVLHAA